MRKNSGKIMFVFMAMALMVMACFSTSHAAYVYTDLANMNLMSYIDLWNIDPTNVAGNQVISSSSTISSSPNFGPTRSFGYVTGDNGDGDANTIFNDGTDVKYITWHTAQPIRLTGVNLFASLDWNSGNPGRAISKFSLFYSLNQGATWTAIVDNFATNVGQSQQDAYSVVGATSRGMAAKFTFDPVTASYFKAEFTQFKGSGARVCELDAIGSAVPLPGAVWLLGSGLLSLAGWRRLRKG
jgi:hypothetical protein